MKELKVARAECRVQPFAELKNLCAVTDHLDLRRQPPAVRFAKG